MRSLLHVVRDLFVLLNLVAILWHCQSSDSFGQAIVVQTKSISIPASYEKVLNRMDGEDAAREMFASQHVSLIHYKARKGTNNQQAEGTSQAKIDIEGQSCEFGTMCYLLSVQATEKQAVIDVELVKPVGMLRRQLYRYHIVPQGEENTLVTISHELDVVLMHRRLKLVNRIISKVTYAKACEQLHSLTGRMADSIFSIGNREVQKKTTTTVDFEGNNENLEDAVEDPSPSDEATEGEPTEESTSQDVSETHNETRGEKTETSSVVSEDEPAPSVPRSEPPASNEQEKLSKGSENLDSIANEEPRAESKGDQISSEHSKNRVHSQEVESHGVANKEPETVSEPEQKPTVAKPTLRIAISGVSVNQGALRIAIFTSVDQFKAFDARKEENVQGEAFRKIAVRVKKSGELIYEVKDLPSGKYVIAAFHDQDGNKKLNSSLLGLPSEPYGFTRDARGSFGAPKFEDAMIVFDEKNTSVSFKLK